MLMPICCKCSLRTTLIHAPFPLPSSSLFSHFITDISWDMTTLYLFKFDPPTPKNHVIHTDTMKKLFILFSPLSIPSETIFSMIIYFSFTIRNFYISKSLEQVKARVWTSLIFMITGILSSVLQVYVGISIHNQFPLKEALHSWSMEHWKQILFTFLFPIMAIILTGIFTFALVIQLKLGEIHLKCNFHFSHRKVE